MKMYKKELTKEEKDRERLGTVLYTALDMSRIIVGLLDPVMPKKMCEARKNLGLGQDVIPFSSLSPGLLVPGTELPIPSPLFPKIQLSSTDLVNEKNQQPENSLNNSNNETIVGTLAYSFGIAPRITGFSYLTSSGKVFKLENKNPQKFGSEIKFITQISTNQKFVSFGRTTYGDDIKQLFTAVSTNGDIYISEKLDSWTKVVTIPLSN